MKTPEVQQKFQTIVVDTADIAYRYCEKYICSREGVETIGDIAFGKGYGLVGTEFDECLRRILQLNYGLVLISHAKDKTFKDENGNEFNQIVPTLDTRGRDICERTCDIIGYSTVVNTDEGPKTKLFMRATPRYMAGSRFAYIPESIDFNYKNLVEAISIAIDRQAEVTGGKYITDEATQVITEEVTYDFDALTAKFQDLVSTLMEKNQSNAVKITSIVDRYLGKGKKVGECSPDQAEQIDLIVHDLELLVKG